MNEQEQAAALRRAAEERLAQLPRGTPVLTANDELLHELRVHQIELEMQNDELRRTQQALEESRDRYVDLFEFAPVGYLGLDRRGMIVACNLTAATLLGLERGRLPGMRLDRLVAAEDREAWGHYIAALWLAGGEENRTCELRLLRGDDTTFCAQVHSVVPEPVTENSVARITLSDVSRRRQAEEELRESQAFLGTVLDAIGEAVVVVDRDFRILKANREYGRQSGCDEGEVRGRHCYEVSHQVARPCDVFGEACAVRQTLTDGCSHTVTHQHFSRDGSQLFVESRSYPLRDAQGRITAVVETQNDITAVKQMEEDQERLRQQLQQSQKMEAIGQLAGGMAHDFNNMLGVILGQAEMALMTAPPDNRLRRSLEEIVKAGQRSAALIAQLLAFARKQTVSPRVLDMNEVVGGMVTMLQRLVGEDIAFSWLPGADIWRVRIDPSQVEQILANLVVNARDAIGGQGHISITTENVVLSEEDVLEMDGARVADYVQLCVADDGCGMEPEVLAHIFEPFFTTKEVGRGTGLGLASVYGSVRQNGGCLRMESAPGRGSSCRILLPRHGGELSPVLLEPGPMAKGGGETLLLVEDEPALLAMTRELLEAFGYRVLAAGNPHEALALVAAHDGTLDMLITDVVMPEMNGRDLAARLADRIPAGRCLFISGYSANVLAERFMLEPDVQLLAKPFSVKELALRVRQMLDQS